MPFHTLSARIAAPAGLFALAGTVLLSYLLIGELRQQALDEAVHGSENLAEVLHLSLDHEMRLNQRQALRTMLRTIGRDVEVESVRVYNKDGEISFSTDSSEVGVRVEKSSPACVACHTGATPLNELDPQRRSRIYRDGDGRLMLGTIRVIENEPGCGGAGCHTDPSFQNVLGVLDVALSLENHEARVRRASREATLVSLGAVAVITTVLYLLITLSVRRPIDAMVRATQTVAEIHNGVPVPRGASREMAILARAFNDLLEGLRAPGARDEPLPSSLSRRLEEAARKLREAQFQIAHAEKLSSVGLVAAGTAHELNSPLMAIITFAHLVRSSLPEGSPAHADLDMIEREAGRCATIIRQLLDFSRKQSEEPEKGPCDVNGAIESALALLEVEIRNADVEVRLDLDGDLPPVEANQVQLMQVFVNLALNAVQAMEHGGRLSITTDRVDRHAFPDLDLPAADSDSLVRIVFRDTGPGIPEDVIGRVFDPFFTTKPVGTGSGLGLSVSLGLIQGFGGTILVRSEGGSGASFIVLLPATAVQSGERETP